MAGPWQARGSPRPAGRPHRRRSGLAARVRPPPLALGPSRHRRRPPPAVRQSLPSGRRRPPTAARALMVLATGLTERGCSAAATVHPAGRPGGGGRGDYAPPRHHLNDHHRRRPAAGGPGTHGSDVGVPCHGAVAHTRRRPRSLFGGKDVGGLGGAWAGGCGVHGGPGGSRGSTGGNDQQRDRFPPAGCGHADCVAGNGGEPVDSDKVAVIGGEPVRDFVPVVAMEGYPLHPHAGPGVQCRDQARQFSMRVAGAWPPSSVDRAMPDERGVKADSRRWQPSGDRGWCTGGAQAADILTASEAQGRLSA
jgi:hypothetical protein